MKAENQTGASISLSFDKTKLQVSVIHEFLTTSYWSPGISEEMVRKALSNSLTVGAYFEDQAQVGLARLVTDYATFGYLADVFVLEGYRGHGIARKMVSAILDLPEVQGMRRLMLATKDAHGVYERSGFERIVDPTSLMQIVRPNIYQRQG